jgi:large repetitive protein
MATTALTYTLTDAAGNESAKSAALTAAVDTTAPATPAAAPTGYTDDAGNLTSASASNTAATTDDTTPGLFVGIGLIDSPKLYVNGTLVAATYNSTTGTLTPNAALTDGNYSFEYTLTDAAGNESAKSAVLSFTVDTTPPSTPSAAPSGYTDDAGSITSS